MPVTDYHENSQDFTTQESQSESVYDDNSNFEVDSFEISPEGSTIQGLSQRTSTTYTPNDTKYLIITKEELSQVRATAILGKVPPF
jgi:hypothetical protein